MRPHELDEHVAWACEEARLQIIPEATLDEVRTWLVAAQSAHKAAERLLRVAEKMAHAVILRDLSKQITKEAVAECSLSKFYAARVLLEVSQNTESEVGHE